MKIYKGKTGLDASWQDNFKANIKCKSCKGNARIMFTAIEDGEEDKYICELYKNTGAKKGGKYWVHDACAVAVYLCEKCFEANAEINQA